MKRHPVTIFFVLTMCLLGVFAITQSQAFARPNIIVIMTDDQRTDDIQAMPQTKKMIVDQGSWNIRLAGIING